MKSRNQMRKSSNIVWTSWIGNWAWHTHTKGMSTECMSAVNLLSMRPMGVLSKNDMGQRTTRWRRSLWRMLEALAEAVASENTRIIIAPAAKYKLIFAVHESMSEGISSDTLSRTPQPSCLLGIGWVMIACFYSSWDINSSTAEATYSSMLQCLRTHQSWSGGQQHPMDWCYPLTTHWARSLRPGHFPSEECS